MHRLLDRYIQDQGLPNVAKLDLHCKHDSMMEKRAADAERASIKYKQVEYLLMRKDQIFSGKISGITNGGFTFKKIVKPAMINVRAYEPNCINA